MLAITGARDDGFHNLVSLVSPTNFGDTLEIELLEEAFCDELHCNMEGVPVDSSNLVMKAAEIFRRETGESKKFFKFNLQKKVPAGAGLGGGSSNAAAALLGMNEICQNILDKERLSKIAAELGSDCPLFLSNKPVVMRGRGELVYELSGDAAEVTQNLKLLIFKPAFSINTGWAYSQMRANPSTYIAPDFAESKISEWLENPSLRGIPLINNMQIAAFKKFPALEITIEDIKNAFHIPAIMSGSGSACFAIVNALSPDKIEELKAFIRARLGETCLVVG